MQGLRRYPDDVVHLDLNPPSSSSTTAPGNLSIDAEESTEEKIQRLISEHPVIIFSRSSCCMCHVMRKLLASIGVHPTVIELDDHEISALPPSSHNDDGPRNPSAPAVFIGGTCVGGLDSLFALHLSGHLVPKLVEVGALWWSNTGNKFKFQKEEIRGVYVGKGDAVELRRGSFFNVQLICVRAIDELGPSKWDLCNAIMEQSEPLKLF